MELALSLWFLADLADRAVAAHWLTEPQVQAQAQIQQDAKVLALTKDAETIANAYLEAHRKDFGLTEKEPLPHIRKSQPSLVVYEAQVYKGIDVLDSAIEINISPEKKVWVHNGSPLVSGKRVANLTLSLKPKLTTKQAQEALVGLTLVDGGGIGVPVSNTLTLKDIQKPVNVVIVRAEDDPDKCFLAWEVSVSSGGQYPWRIYVDAHAGRVVKKVPQYRS